VSLVELWRELPLFPEYEASSLGRVRRLETGKLLTPFLRGGVRGRWHTVDLRREGATTRLPLDTIVAAAFLGRPPRGHDVQHVNGDLLDCRAENLVYVQDDRVGSAAQAAGRYTRRVAVAPIAESVAK